MKKFIAVAQKSGKYFMHAAGLVGAICMIVGVFVVIPPFISLPIGGGIGLVWAIVGAKKALNQVKEEENKDVQRLKALGSIAHIKEDLRELTDEVREDLEELKDDLGAHHHDDAAPIIGKNSQFTSSDSDSDSDTASKKPPKDSPFTVVTRLAHKQQRDLNHVFRFFKRKKNMANKKPANSLVFSEEPANPPLLTPKSTVRIHY